MVRIGRTVGLIFRVLGFLGLLVMWGVFMAKMKNHQLSAVMKRIGLNRVIKIECMPCQMSSTLQEATHSC